MASRKNNPKSDAASWVLIVVLFLVGLWPIALAVLLFKLFGKDGQKRRMPPPLEQQEPAGSIPTPVKKRGTGPVTPVKRRNRAQTAAQRVTQTPAAKTSTARVLKIVGVVIAVVSLLACWEPIDMMIWLGELAWWYIESLLTALAGVVAGIAMLVCGVSMERSLRRYHQYLAVMGNREALAIDELARTLGHPRDRVEKDLQKMIDKGYFGETTYLNLELGYLFRSSEADEALRKEKQQQETSRQEPPKQETMTDYDVILQKIRNANDRIADEALSAKIDQLESITARIFKAVEADPAKRGKIDTFLNYYLPTTQKLLDSYAEFEAAGVEGENLRQAKGRIEAAMDSIVRGFTHQLDELYQADAMDVDSDLRVMENMLRRDTATVAQDFGLDQK